MLLLLVDFEKLPRKDTSI